MLKALLGILLKVWRLSDLVVQFNSIQFNIHLSSASYDLGIMQAARDRKADKVQIKLHTKSQKGVLYLISVL